MYIRAQYRRHSILKAIVNISPMREKTASKQTNKKNHIFSFARAYVDVCFDLNSCVLAA